jgi:hypothetical protein
MESNTLVQQLDAWLQPEQQHWCYHNGGAGVDMCSEGANHTYNTISCTPSIASAIGDSKTHNGKAMIPSSHINLPSQPPTLSKVLAALPAPSATRTWHQSKL